MFCSYTLKLTQDDLSCQTYSSKALMATSSSSASFANRSVDSASSPIEAVCSSMEAVDCSAPAAFSSEIAAKLVNVSIHLIVDKLLKSRLVFLIH